MNKVFCVSCGFKILYEISKPKFCSNCGESVGSISTSKTKEKDGLASQEGFDIERLKRDVVIEKSSGGLDVKDLWANSNGPIGGSVEGRAASKDPEGKDLLDQTLKDCASSRMRDIDE